MAAMHKNDVDARVGRYLLGGLAVSFLIVGGIAGWAATTQIAGAVVASAAAVSDAAASKPIGRVDSWKILHQDHLADRSVGSH